MRAHNPFLDQDRRDQLQQRLQANGRRLKPRELEVLQLRAGLAAGSWPHSIAEIAEQFGVTHNRIRQIEKAALTALDTSPDLGPYLSPDDEYEMLRAQPISKPIDAVPGAEPALVLVTSERLPLTLPQARTILLSREARTGDTLRQLLASWLATVESEHSRAAYMRDLTQYFDYCIEHNLDPLTVRIQEFNLFTVWLRVHVNATGKPYARTTRARKISAVSSFYRHLVDVDAVDRSPVTAKARIKTRPSPPDHAISAEDTIALIDDASSGHRTIGPLCAALIIELLFNMGLRVSEVCNLDIDQLTVTERDGRLYRGITFTAKGNEQKTRGIPHEMDVEWLAPYLAQRPEPATLEDAPALLLTLDGRRLNRHQVARLVKRAAIRRLGRPVTPHYGRHTFNRRCIEADIDIEMRRQAMGHKSVVTTQGYGQARNDVTDDPSHIVAAVLHLARTTNPCTTSEEGHHHDDYRSRPA